jgi:ABC-2 type transport system ATP-binding protein
MNISIKNLTKTYKGKTHALKGVNIEIPEGLFGLIGRNGAGKTTLMRIVATVIRQNSGEVLFDDKNIFENLEEFRGMLGYLPQNTKLMPHLNIVEFLDYVSVLKGIKDKLKRKAEVQRCIEIVGLVGEEKKKLSKYSGGMLRRAGIAQALIGDPKILIIDEPTSGLDPEERLYFLNMLSRIGGNKTIIFSTHITHDIENICENVCVLETGSVMYIGRKQELIDKIKNRIWECIAMPADESKLKEKSIVTSVTYINNKPVIRYISDESIYENSVKVEPSLEDAYIFTLGGVKR